MRGKHGVIMILCFFFCSAPSFSFATEIVKGDINDNGVQDLTAFFNSDALSKVELDRNEDGKVDAWLFFTTEKKRWDTRADYDENFDGRIDEIYFIKNDEPVRSLIDKNLDGLLDWETTYGANGLPSGKRQVDPPLDPATFNI